MIVWILCLAALALSTTKCEPPVNSYLPPNSGIGSGGRPSSQYGPPGGNQGRSPGGLNSASSGVNPSFPSSVYGVPGQGSGNFPRGRSRDSLTQGQGSFPSSEYGRPNQQGTNGASGPFSGRGSSQRPDSSYGTPSNEYQTSSGASFNGINAGQGSRQPFGGSPSSFYGTPDFGNDLNIRNQNYHESGVNESNEPAKHEFSYEVDDSETGTKFGHSERRDGDVTMGEYNVVLPDGRKQVVEYEADQEGYKPQIRYEGTGNGFGSGFGPGVSANANARSEAGYPQSGGRQQSGRDQEPGSGFGQGSGTAGYPSGRPGDQGFGNQGLDGSGYSDSRGSNGFPGSGSPGGGNQRGYPSGPQGSRGRTRGSGRGSNGVDGENGYPSGGPDGPRGSGY